MTRAEPIQVEVQNRGFRRFMRGVWRGIRSFLFVGVVGAILIGGVHSGEASPVKAERAIQERQHVELLNAEYEEDQRQAEYAQAGPPAPTEGWYP